MCVVVDAVSLAHNFLVSSLGSFPIPDCAPKHHGPELIR